MVANNLKLGSKDLWLNLALAKHCPSLGLSERVFWSGQHCANVRLYPEDILIIQSVLLLFHADFPDTVLYTQNY